MILIFGLFLIFVVIYYPILFIEWVMRKIGILKPIPKIYFTNDIIKSQGYTYEHYRTGNDIVCILRVQKELERLYKDDSAFIDAWSYIQQDLRKNWKMEEEYIKRLTKQII